MSESKYPIFPILLVNFIGILGFSIIVPILIFIVTDFGGNGFIYGILGSVYPFFQFIGSPILGKFSDRVGRKKVLVLSQIGTFICWLMFLLAFALPKTALWSQDTFLTGSYTMTLPLLLLFIARTLDGFTGGNISVANAYLSDVSNRHTREDNFGKMGASTSLGFVAGPAVAGVLAATAWGNILPVLVAALVSFSAIFIIKSRLRESLPDTLDVPLFSKKGLKLWLKGDQDEAEPEQERPSWKSMFQMEFVPSLFAIYFFTFLGFSVFYSGWPVYTSQTLGWSAGKLGGFMAYFSVVMALVQGPGRGWLSKRVKAYWLVLAGTAILGSGFLLLMSDHFYVLVLGVTIMAFGNGIMWPSFLSLLSRIGDKKKQGAVQGYGGSMGSIGSILGLIIGGLSVELIGGQVFLVSSVLVFAMLFPILRLGEFGKSPDNS